MASLNLVDVINLHLTKYRQYITTMHMYDFSFLQVAQIDVQFEGDGLIMDPVFKYNASVGIFPHTTYSFTVQACNEIGCSQLDSDTPIAEIRTEQEGERIN